MRRTRKTDPCFMVTDPATHSGAVYKARDHREAALRAMGPRQMGGRGIACVSVRLFAGSVDGDRDTRAVRFDVSDPSDPVPIPVPEHTSKGAPTMTASNPSKTYNDWTNRETWAVVQWLGNEEKSWSYWADRAAEVYRDSEAVGDATRGEVAARALAGELWERHEEQSPCAERSDVFADLMSAALARVNWVEIAGRYIGDLDTAAIDAE